MHIVRADADETVGFDLGVRGPAEAGEGGWFGDDAGVARERAGREADVGATGEDEAIGEDHGAADDAVHGDCLRYSFEFNR